VCVPESKVHFDERQRHASVNHYTRIGVGNLVVGVAEDVFGLVFYHFVNFKGNILAYWVRGANQRHVVDRKRSVFGINIHIIHKVGWNRRRKANGSALV
jgi:hypothetical protein